MSSIKMDAHDQAAGLRRLFTSRGAQLVALTSAVSIPGRSQLVAGAAFNLATRGRRVLLLDENPAPRNASSLLLESTRAGADLLQVIRGEVSLAQATLRINRNLAVLGVDRLANAELPLTRRLADLLQQIEDGYELVIVDCSASRTNQVSTLGLQARGLVVAVTAASNGIMQAYAQIKRLAQFHHREHFQIVVTGKVGRDEARVIFNNLRKVADEHLGVQLAYLGLVNPGRAEMLADLLDTGLSMPVMNLGNVSELASTLGFGMGMGPQNSVV